MGFGRLGQVLSHDMDFKIEYIYMGFPLINAVVNENSSFGEKNRLNILSSKMAGASF